MRSIILSIVGVLTLSMSGCGGGGSSSIVAPGYEEVKPHKPSYSKPSVVAPGYKKVNTPSIQTKISPSKKYSKIPIKPKF